MGSWNVSSGSGYTNPTGRKFQFHLKQDTFSRTVFERQHWLLCGQFVAMCVPCVVALILAGWHLKLPIDDYVTMIYWLAYLGDWIVVLITLAISFVTWQSHSNKIRDIY